MRCDVVHSCCHATAATLRSDVPQRSENQPEQTMRYSTVRTKLNHRCAPEVKIIINKEVMSLPAYFKDEDTARKTKCCYFNRLVRSQSPLPKYEYRPPPPTPRDPIILRPVLFRAICAPSGMSTSVETSALLGFRAREVGKRSVLFLSFRKYLGNQHVPLFLVGRCP